MGYIEIIDPETGEVLFDSDKVTPEMMDPQRDYMAGGQYGQSSFWSISTPEQVERQVEAERPSITECDTCEHKGVLFSLGEWIICPTCHGVVR